MRPIRYYLDRAFYILILCLFAKIALSQNSIEKDKTIAPWLHIAGDESAMLPLLSTSADVNIAGVIADVTIRQVFHNTGDKPIEAVYVFPSSTRAAVYAMQMSIGKRTITAQIEEKEKAQKAYDKAKSEGRTASLLKQHRPNVFEMNVANILPGDTIVVDMKYTELLIPENGMYQFIFPTVVGPRYSNKKVADVPQTQQWVANPYTSESTSPGYSFNMEICISAGMPVKDIKCNTHKTIVRYEDATSASVVLDPIEKYSANRDFVLDYRLTGDKIQTGLMLYEGVDEKFFMAMIQPPQNIRKTEIPPREYFFIVDVSGSMSGFPLDVSKELIRNLIGNLNPTDMFNVLLFAGNSSLMSEKSLPATKKNIDAAMDLIDNQNGSGGTELLPALNRALELERLAGYSSTFIILTDGYVDVEKEAFELVRNNLSNANFFSFGIGTSVNRLLVEGIAKAGQGEVFVALNQEEARAKADLFRNYIQNPMLTDIRISFNGFDAYDVEPVNIPDMFAQRPIIVYGKWKGEAKGSISISGVTGDGKWDGTMNVANVKTGEENAALRYLWARKQIEVISDYDVIRDFSLKKKRITELGMQYSLLTDYTSFIAIDKEIRTKVPANSIKQPLPMPDGVSNNAVGYANNSSSGTTQQTVFKIEVVEEVKEEEYIEIAIADEQIITQEFALPVELAIVEEQEPAFVVVEEQATFNGGDLRAFQQWVNSQIEYPEIAIENEIQGRVIVQFTVDEKGQIGDIVILRGVDPSLDNEVIRVLKLSTFWKPARQGGFPVKQKFTLPISFTLEGGKMQLKVEDTK